MKSFAQHPLALACLLAGLTAMPASANLYFSEYIEGSSNNKALEIYNSSASAINFTIGHSCSQT